MGGFSSSPLPILPSTTPKFPSLDPFSVIFNVASTGLDLARKRAQTNANVRAAQARTQRLIALERHRLAAEENQKRERLKVAQAAQRARFGSGGIGSTGGSAAAVLAGLQKHTDRAIADDRFLSNARIQDLNDAFQQTRSRNLLEASAPLRRIVLDETQRRLPHVRSLLGD